MTKKSKVPILPLPMLGKDYYGRVESNAGCEEHRLRRVDRAKLLSWAARSACRHPAMFVRGEFWMRLRTQCVTALALSLAVTATGDWAAAQSRTTSLYNNTPRLASQNAAAEPLHERPCERSKPCAGGSTASASRRRIHDRRLPASRLRRWPVLQRLLRSGLLQLGLLLRTLLR